MSDLRTTTPESIKKLLRKSKKLPACMKAALYAGCLKPEVAIQLNEDVITYNVYEALLYVESYEQGGCYAPGTAQKAMDAFWQTKAAKKVLAEAMAAHS
jgi:hypothetical protein